jgi:hypothetical protein
MPHLRRALAGLLVALPAAADPTPNDFLRAGAPTFVVGTRGDALSDRVIAGQVELVRGALFPDAKVVADTTIDVARGPEGWPPRPAIYGGPHVHATLAALAPVLPFSLGPGRLAIGDRVFEGPGVALVAVVPARAADARGPGHPELLVFAGTGTPGVAEINSGLRGDRQVTVADAFGPLATGTWTSLSPPARRIEWRGAGGVFFPAMLPPAAGEDATAEACARGVATARRKLAQGRAPEISIYVYPDARSKQSLTGRGGDGHAVAYAHAVHVLGGVPPAALEALVAHEATHVLAAAAWGIAGSPLLGEGLAVWVAGGYAGVPLATWRERLGAHGVAAELLGPAFRKLPEAEAYPRGGLLVEDAVKEVGLAKVREHLYPATAATWVSACKKAGLAGCR